MQKRKTNVNDFERKFVVNKIIKAPFFVISSLKIFIHFILHWWHHISSLCFIFIIFFLFYSAPWEFSIVLVILDLFLIPGKISNRFSFKEIRTLALNRAYKKFLERKLIKIYQTATISHFIFFIYLFFSSNKIKKIFF